MLLAHAIAIAEARSYLAALADQAVTFWASVAYDDVLLYVDAIHGDAVPALDELPTIELSLLHDLAEKSLLDLARHGLDPLQIELVLAMVNDARERDAPSEPPAPPGERS
jgi:hypothetical protein